VKCALLRGASGPTRQNLLVISISRRYDTA